MRRDYQLTYTGDEVQALLDKINALGPATTTVPGIMTIEDKAKLDGLSIQANTTQYWDDAVGYIPNAGEIIIYTDYAQVQEGGVTKDIPGIKIGSGNAYVQDLAFLGADQANQLLDHISNSNIHITAAERVSWNRRLNVDDNSEVVNETLIFIRN